MRKLIVLRLIFFFISCFSQTKYVGVYAIGNRLLAIFICSILLISCSSDGGSSNADIPTSEATISFYNVDAAVSFPVSVYIDNVLMGYTSASYMTNHIPDCGSMDLNIHPTPGSHSFALVASNDYFSTGNFSIGKGACQSIPYNGSNFTSINYGTTNGSLSILTNVLNLNPVSVTVDNISVGTLQGAPLGYICGESNPGYVINLDLVPGQHSYSAIENMSGGGTRTWQGTVMISANQCRPLILGL